MYLLVHLPVQVERQKRGLRQDDTSRGLVIGGRPWDASVVLDCCPVAEAAGVRPGMPLARAVMRCPKADFVPADHTAYQEAQQALFTALLQFTDRIETAGLGMFFVEAGQLARRFPEDEKLTRATVAALREALTLDVQVGLAEERFTAEQAGLAARPNRAVVVPPRSGRSFLSSLPLTVLPATPEIIRRLDLLGIRTLGEMAALPRVALVRQFGPQAGFLRDLATGADPRPVVPDAPPRAAPPHNAPSAHSRPSGASDGSAADGHGAGRDPAPTELSSAGAAHRDRRHCPGAPHHSHGR